MGHSTLDRFYESYSHIRDSVLAARVFAAAPVLILATPETDSLCALRILVALLKSDSVAYSVAPVAGYSDLRTIKPQYEHVNTAKHRS